MGIITILLVLFTVISYFASKESFIGTIETFITPQPPILPEKPLHWRHNYSEKAQLKEDVIHVDRLTNAFPMQKPPSTWEKTMEGSKDVARSGFLPHMRKRGETS